MAIRAKASSGRIIVDEPTLLPEGTTLNLIVDDEGDDLDAEERAALDAHLAAAWKNVQLAMFALPTSCCPSYAHADEVATRRHDPRSG